MSSSYQDQPGGSCRLRHSLWRHCLRETFRVFTALWKWEFGPITNAAIIDLQAAFICNRPREGCEVLRWLCVFVCLSVRSHIYFGKTHDRTLHTVVHVARGRGSVLLWRRCDTLCTSGFVNDVMFSHSGLYCASFVFLNARAQKAKTTAMIPTKFCSTINTIKYSSRVVHRSEVCYLLLPCFTLIF